jgi:hypothetical protein
MLCGFTNEIFSPIHCIYHRVPQALAQLDPLEITLSGAHASSMKNEPSLTAGD